MGARFAVRGARLLALALCAAALLAGEVHIRIHPTTTVLTPRATIGDVAEVAGDDEASARVRGLVVAELPTLTAVAIDARLIAALATRVAAPATLVISGSGRVARQARTFSAEELSSAAVATVPGARTTLLRCSGELTVPDGATLLAEQLDPQAVGDVPFRVRALEDGRETGRALVVLRVEREVAVVVATRALRRGDAIAPDDIRCESRSATRANLLAVVDPAVLVGGFLSRDLAAGDAVQPSVVSARPAVRAGSVVTAVLPGRGFSVEVQVTALADARAGERVGVRRIGERIVISSIAQADGSVLIQP